MTPCNEPEEDDIGGPLKLWEFNVILIWSAVMVTCGLRLVLGELGILFEPWK